MSHPAMSSRTIPTDVLLDEVESRTGSRPEPYQLHYWVKKGLLPEPDQRRPGRGKGSIVLWAPECLDRLVLMMRTRTGKNLSVNQAGRILVFKGYPLLRDRLFKNALKELIHDVEKHAQLNRTFLNRTDITGREKQRRLMASVNRRNRDVAEPFRTIASTYTSSLLSLPAADSSPLVSAFVQIGSLRSLADAIDAIDLSDLYEAFDAAGEFAGFTLPLVRALAQTIPATGILPENPTANGYLDTNVTVKAWLGPGVEIAFTDFQRFVALLACIGACVAAKQHPEAVGTFTEQGQLEFAELAGRVLEPLSPVLAGFVRMWNEVAPDTTGDSRDGEYEI